MSLPGTFFSTSHCFSSLLTFASPSHKQKLPPRAQNLISNLPTAYARLNFLTLFYKQLEIWWNTLWVQILNVFLYLLLLKKLNFAFCCCCVFVCLQHPLPRQLMSVTAIRQTKQGWNSLEELQDGIWQRLYHHQNSVLELSVVYIQINSQSPKRQGLNKRQKAKSDRGRKSPVLYHRDNVKPLNCSFTKGSKSQKENKC